MNKFLLICPIGFEKSVLRELEIKELISHIDDYQIIKGGVEIRCELNFGLELNKHLRCVSRILLRLKEQRCRDYPKLFQIISKFNFHPYLVQEKINFEITTHKSRIINTKKALLSANDAFEKYLKGQKLKENIINQYLDAPVQSIYIRIYEDNLSLSIDTTGILAHIRGNKEKQGHAPLRETYASCLLMEIYQEDMQEMNLVDPMCGSGTILKEAKQFFQPIERQYIFKRWPLYQATKSTPINKSLFKNYIGYDRDSSVIDKSQGIEYIKADFFTEIKELPFQSIVLTNPPYGKRIKIKGDRKDYFIKYIERLKTLHTGASFFIAPSEIPIKLNKLKSFNNSGIQVNLYRVN